jgi:hypothetical protein
MAHKVKFQAPERELGKADVVFQVRDDAGMIGTLKVSRGSLVWFPSDTSIGHRVSWSRFNTLIKENVSGIEMR